MRKKQEREETRPELQGLPPPIRPPHTRLRGRQGKGRGVVKKERRKKRKQCTPHAIVTGKGTNTEMLRQRHDQDGTPSPKSEIKKTGNFFFQRQRFQEKTENTSLKL